MKPKVKDAVDCTIDAMREGLRALYQDAVPEIFTEEFWLSVDERARLEVGGTSEYVRKTPLRVESQKMSAVWEFARGAPAPKAARGNGISRATLYRSLNRKTCGPT